MVLLEYAGYGAIAIAMLAMAANQAAKDAESLAAKLKGFPLNGRMTYLPLGLGVLGVLSLAAFYVFATTPISPSNEMEAVNVEGGGGDELTVQGLPISRILGFFDEHTDFQAKQLIAPYEGSIVTISGQIDNVIGYDTGGGIVTLLKDGDSYSELRLFFEAQHTNALGRLQQGDHFAARCVFDGMVDRIGVSLERCEPLYPAAQGN